MRIVVSRKAQRQRDNPEAADRLLGRIVNITDLLASRAIVGREVRLRDGRSVQTWPVPPFRIYYRKLRDSLQIYHQARQPIEE